MLLLKLSSTGHTAVITGHCFRTYKAGCVVNILLTMLSIASFILMMAVFYRVRYLQYESLKSTRMFIIYTSTILTIFVFIHTSISPGGRIAIIISFLILLEITFVTSFFGKILSRTISLSSQKEKQYQSIFLGLLVPFELIIIIYSLARFKSINCHKWPFIVFAILEGVLTIITVVSVKRVMKESNRVMIISQVIEEQKHKRSRDLKILMYLNTSAAFISIIYEFWNLVSSRKCDKFSPSNNVAARFVNESIRFVVRISWEFIPVWMICYIFWDWPAKDNIHLSHSSYYNKDLLRYNRQISNSDTRFSQSQSKSSTYDPQSQLYHYDYTERNYEITISDNTYSINNNNNNNNNSNNSNSINYNSDIRKIKSEKVYITRTNKNDNNKNRITVYSREVSSDYIPEQLMKSYSRLSNHHSYTQTSTNNRHITHQTSNTVPITPLPQDSSLNTNEFHFKANTPLLQNDNGKNNHNYSSSNITSRNSEDQDSLVYIPSRNDINDDGDNGDYIAPTVTSPPEEIQTNNNNKNLIINNNINIKINEKSESKSRSDSVDSNSNNNNNIDR